MDRSVYFHRNGFPFRQPLLPVLVPVPFLPPSLNGFLTVCQRLLYPLANFLLAHDLLYCPYIRGLSSSHEGNSYDCADMAYMALVVIRVFLVVLRLCRISAAGCNLSYLLEPLALIIAVIICGEIFSKNFICIFCCLFRILVFYLKGLIEEVADEADDLPCIYQVFPYGFLSPLPMFRIWVR